MGSATSGQPNGAGRTAVPHARRIAPATTVSPIRASVVPATQPTAPMDAARTAASVSSRTTLTFVGPEGQHALHVHPVKRASISSAPSVVRQPARTAVAPTPTLTKPASPAARNHSPAGSKDSAETPPIAAPAERSVHHVPSVRFAPMASASARRPTEAHRSETPTTTTGGPQRPARRQRGDAWWTAQNNQFTRLLVTPSVTAISACTANIAIPATTAISAPRSSVTSNASATA